MGLSTGRAVGFVVALGLLGLTAGNNVDRVLETLLLDSNFSSTSAEIGTGP